MNSNPSLRVDNVWDYIKAYQRKEVKRDKALYVDKGQDILLNGYTEEEFERVYRKLQARGDKSPEYHFRILINLLLSYYILTRSESRRTAEILDLFTFKFPNEGPTRYLPFIFTTRVGKQNQYGRLETIRVL